MILSLIFAATLVSTPTPNDFREDRGAQAFAHAVRAELLCARRVWVEAEREARLALVFDHDAPYLRALLARTLFEQGQPQLAMRELDKLKRAKIASHQVATLVDSLRRLFKANRPADLDGAATAVGNAAGADVFPPSRR